MKLILQLFTVLNCKALLEKDHLVSDKLFFISSLSNFGHPYFFIEWIKLQW